MSAGPSTSSSPPVPNVYYERKVATPRACYMCRRETSTVLATIKTEDFLYTCEGHLSDPATLIPAAAPSTPTPSADDIRKVITDYESRQARKAENDKDKDKDKDKDGKDTDKKSDAASPSSPKPSTPTSPSPAPSASATHRKYALHRQVWEMRKAELKKRDMSARAKEVGRGLPQVPRTQF